MKYDVVGVSDLRHRIRNVLDIHYDIVGLGLRGPTVVGAT